MQAAATVDKPRVVLLADSPYFGGITSHLLTVFHAMAGSPFDVRLATLPGRRADTALIEACRDQGIPLHEFSMDGAFDRSILPQLRRFIAENQIDLVHTHGYRGTLLCRFARLAVPIVNTCHGLSAERSFRLKAWQWAELRAMRRHRLTIACSDQVRGWLDKQHLDPQRIRTIRNAYDPGRVTQRVSGRAQRDPTSVATRRQLGIRDSDLVVLFAGRLCDGKGVDVLIQSLASASGITCLIAGDGAMRSYLELLAKNAEAPVRFLGQISQLAPYYELSDVVVLPSRMEALPMVLIEAAAFGRPCIASRVGGIPEIVEDARSGLLIEYGNPPVLREAIGKLKDSALRDAMGRRAREIWREKFTPQRFARELAAAYSDALESRAPGG